MKLNKKQIIGMIFGLAVIISSIVFFRDTNFFYFIGIIGLIVGVTPFVLTLILERSRQKQVESKFLEFIRDLVENVKAGTPISKSILILKDRSYGPLSPYVQKLANQISLGIPLNDSLITFAQDTKSKVISRAVSLISEAQRAGGKIDIILESVSSSVNQIENLKKERKSAVSNLVVQGYIIFVVFILIMLILQFIILPWVGQISDVGDVSLNVKPASVEEVSSRPMFFLILLQSFFAGFVIGKISEGSFRDGIKHSFILLAITLVITSGANAFFGLWWGFGL